MIITILVLLYLAMRAVKGYHTGFISMIVGLIFSGIAFILAIMLQNPVGNWVYQQLKTSATLSLESSLELMICRFVAFFVLFFILKRVMRLIRKMLPFQHSQSSNLGHTLNSVLGAIASLVAGYFFMYVCLSMASSFDNAWISSQIASSSFLHFIIYSTPGLSNGVFKSLFSISRTAA